MMLPNQSGFPRGYHISGNKRKSHIVCVVVGLFAGGGSKERKGHSFLVYSAAPGPVCLSPTRPKYDSEFFYFHQEFLGKKRVQRFFFFKEHHRGRPEEQLGLYEQRLNAQKGLVGSSGKWPTKGRCPPWRRPLLITGGKE